MTKIQKIILSLVAGITVMLLFTVASMGGKANLGGTFNQVAQYFYQGLYAGTSNQFSVSNTGALTTTGATSLGSITAGVNYYKPIVAVTADVTATVAQTGTIFQMGTAGVDVTLPAPTVASGVHYRFVVSGAVATTDMTIVAGTADTIEGTLLVAGAVVDCDANDLITFVVDGENIGDYVDLYSDGVKWMIGSSGALTASKMTCTG